MIIKSSISKLIKNLQFNHLYGNSLFVFIFAGCINTSNIQEPVNNVPNVTLSSYSSIIKNETTLIEKEIPNKWWNLFNDSTLSFLEDEATKSNLDILSAVTRIDESRARLGLVTSNLSPQIDGVAGYSHQALSENEPLAKLGATTSSTNSYNIGLQSKWEVDLWGYLRQQVESAKATLEATNFEKESIKVSISADIARTYLLLRGVQSQLKIYYRQNDIAQQLLHLTQSQQNNGIANKSDVAVAIENVAKIKAQQLQLENQRDKLINALTLLLGKYPRELDDKINIANFATVPNKIPVSISSELALKRPDIMQSEANLRATLADIGAAESDFYPRINLVGSFGMKGIDFSDLGSWDSRHYSIGPSFYLPIFQGGRLERNLELSTTRHRLAALNYQKVVLNAWHEIDNSLDTYIAESKRHTQLELILEQKQATLNTVKCGYVEGTQSLKSVLEAERTLLFSEFELIDSSTSSALSIVSIYRSLGGNWTADLQHQISLNKSN